MKGLQKGCAKEFIDKWRGFNKKLYKDRNMNNMISLIYSAYIF